MKKILAFLCCAILFSAAAYGQAKKPKLIVVPANTWMNQNNFMTPFTDMSGKTQSIPDYKAAFDNDEYVSMIIGAMEDFMKKENYNVGSLKQGLDNLARRNARKNAQTAGGGVSTNPINELNKVVKPDIKVELHYAIKRQGPYKYLEFNVSAVDAYTGAPVSTGNLGRGTAAASYDIVNQLEEAVLSFKDKFITDMDQYYERLFQNGRPIVITCMVAENSPINYEEDFGGEELGQLIKSWMEDNAYKGNFNLSDATEDELFFDEVRIPMTYNKDGVEKGTDADWFGKQLQKFIEATTGVKCKVTPVGLGEVELLLGGKEG